MFYISRNTLAVTPVMTKKQALALWAEESGRSDLMPGRYQLCKHTDSANPVVVQELK